MGREEVKLTAIVGNGTSGSWKIRGEQLGHDINAIVNPRPELFKHFKLAIVVKRPNKGTLAQLRAADTRIIWDIVDAWPQPEGNTWQAMACFRWLNDQIRLIQPDAIVAATRAMADDLRAVGFTGPVLALPHHARPG